MKKHFGLLPTQKNIRAGKNILFFSSICTSHLPKYLMFALKVNILKEEQLQKLFNNYDYFFQVVAPL